MSRFRWGAGLSFKVLKHPLALCAAFLELSGDSALADEAVAQVTVIRTVGLQPLDWVLIAIYAISTIGLGVYFSRKQNSTEEYFVGGGNINSLLIGVSLFATLLSTISYLSIPGESAGKGPVILFSLLGYPLIYFIIAHVLLPVYMRHRVTSAYELLEERLGLSIRLLGAVMFITLRLFWMTLLVYLAAKALTVMMGVDPQWIPLIVLVTGVVSVIYTTLGGLRAVVVTDFMQTMLLFGGALLVLLTVSWSLGGLGWFPTTWHPNWDTQPFFSFDPQTRVTVVGTILSVLTWYVCTAGGDQTVIQRFMATTDLRAARRAVATQLTVGVIVGLTLTLVGFALLGYFQANSGDLPEGMDLKANADDLFPHYIAFYLPMGVSGLVVAAMFAAAMSSIDSGVNSVTAVVMTDFAGSIRLEAKNRKGSRARGAAVGAGHWPDCGAGQLLHGIHPRQHYGHDEQDGQPADGTHFRALLFRPVRARATAPGVWIGTVLAIVSAALIAFSGPLVYWLHTQFGVDPAMFNVEVITKIDPVSGEPWKTCVDPISFQWIGPVSLTVSILVGTAVSLILPRRDLQKVELK